MITQRTRLNARKITFTAVKTSRYFPEEAISSAENEVLTEDEISIIEEEIEKINSEETTEE
jgi:hypothetical protein